MGYTHRTQASMEAVWEVVTLKVLGPVRVWHLVALLVYALVKFGGGMQDNGPKVTASHILVDDESDCVAIKDKIANGAAFADMAKENSKCSSKSGGGALGTFSRGQMVPEFDRVCWSAPIGVVQGPVKTQFGYHLILVTARDEETKKND